jgi:hypothetical protein
MELQIKKKPGDAGRRLMASLLVRAMLIYRSWGGSGWILLWPGPGMDGGIVSGQVNGRQTQVTERGNCSYAAQWSARPEIQRSERGKWSMR